MICRGKAKSHAVGPEDHDYELDMELFAAVSAEDSKISVTPRCVFLLVAKKATDEEYWPRLTKSKDKQANVKVQSLEPSCCPQDGIEWLTQV